MKNLTVPGEYSSTCHVESKRLPYIAHIAASDYKCKLKGTQRNGNISVLYKFGWAHSLETVKLQSLLEYFM